MLLLNLRSSVSLEVDVYVEAAGILHYPSVRHTDELKYRQNSGSFISCWMTGEVITGCCK